MSENLKKLWRIMIRDLTLQGSIGIYEEEFAKSQQILVNVECEYVALVPKDNTDVSQVVLYDDLCYKIQQLVGSGHIYFVERLADQVATLCLEDERVHAVKVCIEKFPKDLNVKSVGIEVTRHK